MPVTVKVQPFPLDSSVLSNEGLMREVGDLAVRLILQRTREGKDVTNAPFLPLSDAYAKRRAKEGYGTTSNLTLSGGMLDGMRVIEASGNKVTLGFTGDSQRGGRGGTLVQRSREIGGNPKAVWHHLTGAGRSRVKRPFFDLTDGDKALLTERVRAYLDRVIRAAQSGAAGLASASRVSAALSGVVARVVRR